MSRAASRAARQARWGKAARQPESAYRYPAQLNIYRHGALMTSLIGVFRLATLVILILGNLFYFPAYTYSYLFPAEMQSEREEKVKWYLPPLFLIGSWVPALVAFFIYAPQVHQIHVHLPGVARKSHQELMRWASNVPRHTILSISLIRVKPWPVVQHAAIEDLSRLPKSLTRLTNLELKPWQHYDYLADNDNSLRARFWEAVSRSVFGRFYVSRTQATSKSAAPGVWDKIWDQIPMEGERVQRRNVIQQRRAETKPPTPRIAPSSRPKS